MILQRSSKFFGTTRRSLNHRTPSVLSETLCFTQLHPLSNVVHSDVCLLSADDIFFDDIFFDGLDCPMEPLGDSALWGHNRNGETGWRDGCIGACGLEHLQPHWPFWDGSELPTHNP
jgi:hypothetical protein